MNISQLFVYPIKSASAIETHHANLDSCGFQHDRRFMIVDAHGRFCTQREYLSLACVQPRIDGETLVVSAPKFPSLVLPLEPRDGPRLQVHIWDDVCEAIAMDHESSLWFSELLQVPCSIVYLPVSKARIVDPRYALHNDRVAFADGFPILLASMSSLKILNQQLHQPVTIHRFRPNIVIDGANPFDEHHWRIIQVNEVSFRVAKACSRCVIVNVDPFSGKREREPLKTLATFRVKEKKVYFGQNLIHNSIGTISVGSAVHVLEEEMKP